MLVLPAYIIDGYIIARIFKGTCTRDIFKEFIIKQVLPIYTPYLGLRSVIIMDNVSIYHLQVERLIETARRYGV